MGLQMTLTRDNNSLYCDFTGAYWAIDEVAHDIEKVWFRLVAYPSREAKFANRTLPVNPNLGYGRPVRGMVECELYYMPMNAPVADVFTDGVIPAGRNAQYTAIYNWIKSYTQLPFEDVFELMEDED